MLELSLDRLRAFLRQCIACFGGGRIVFVGAPVADALDVLLSEGLDACALALEEPAWQDALRRFAPHRVGLVQAGQPLPADIGQHGFGALVLVDTGLDPVPVRQRLKAAADAGIPNIAILAPARSADGALDEGALALGYRSHARADFARAAYASATLPGKWHVRFFERAAIGGGQASPAEDFLRGTDPASLATFSSFARAADWVRVGDTVLVLDDTAGSGAYVIACNCGARTVLALQTDPAQYEYASAQYARPGRVEFRFMPRDGAMPPAPRSVDVLVCLNAGAPSSPDWQRLIDAVRPGGRLVLGFAAGQASGRPDSAAGLLGRTVGAAMQRCLPEAALVSEIPATADRPAAWRSVGLHDPVAPGSGLAIVVAMIDPVDAEPGDFTETVYRSVDRPDFSVLPDRRSMRNPWLFKSMIAGGMRLTNDSALELVRTRVRQSAPPDSADYGAALCGHAYRLLSARAQTAEVQACLDDIQAYLGIASDNVHHLRWSISLSYVAAKLAQSVGDLQAALEWALRCAAMDPVPFSPLLGTKTIAALDLAATLALSRHDQDAARGYLERAVREVPRMLSGDWLNILGDPRKPLSFGFPEVAQLAEAGARCAYLLNYLDDSEFRPGWVRREHRGFYERIAEAKDGYAKMLALRVESLSGEIRRLEDFIQGQRAEADRLEHVIMEKERVIREKERVIRKKNQAVIDSEGISILTLARRRLWALAQGLRDRLARSQGPAAVPVRAPNAPLLLDEDRVVRWIGGFEPAQPEWTCSAVLAPMLPAGAGHAGASRLRIIAAGELPALGKSKPDADTVTVAVFQDGDNPYALRSLVYEHVDLCVALDRAVFLALALLHPMVAEARPDTLFDCAARFYQAAAGGHRMPVPRSVHTLPPSTTLMLQVDNFMVGGLERVVFDLMAHLTEAGCLPMLGVTGEIAPEAENELRQRQFRYVRLPGDADALRKVLHDERVALVNAHYSLSLSEPCASLGIPFVQTVHNMYMWLDAAGKEAWRHADQVTDAYICVSANVAMFADVNLRLSTDRMIVVPNGCDADSGRPLAQPEADAALREELGFPPDGPVFVNVASINPIKAQGLLIDAFAIAHAQRPDIRLVILGKHSDPAYVERLQARIAQHGLEDAVRLPGYRSDVYRFVDLARAVVMPSFSEGWSLAISEALQRNAPVIATDVGGAREQLVDDASTVIRAYRDDWSTLDNVAFFDAVANEWDLHSVRDELARALVDYAGRPVRQLRTGLRQSFQSMSPAEAYARHAEIFSALLGRTYADGVRHACRRPQRQSRYVEYS